jgi:hypothetical protein
MHIVLVARGVVATMASVAMVATDEATKVER